MTHAEQSARRVVKAIVRDLTDRRGLRQTWESIDAEVRAEILAKWQKIVRDELDGHAKP